MMYILKHSMAGALVLLFITGGTLAQDNTVLGFNLPQDSRTSKDRAVQCFTAEDITNCTNQITVKYPNFEAASESTAEEFCMGLFWWHRCCMRTICKQCSSELADKAAAKNTKRMETIFTTGNCKGFKPHGDLKLSCSSDIRGFTIPNGYTWSGNFAGNSAGTSAGNSAGNFADNSAGNSVENSSRNSVDKSLQILAGITGILVVFGLIGVLLFSFFKKKKKKKEASSKTGQSTTKSSALKHKSTTGGSGVKSSKSSATKPKSSIRGTKSTAGSVKSTKSATKPKSGVRSAKSSKSTTA